MMNYLELANQMVRFMNLYLYILTQYDIMFFFTINVMFLLLLLFLFFEEIEQFNFKNLFSYKCYKLLLVLALL